MFIALDENGNRISIEDAVIGEKYYCPCCDTELLQKRGNINVHHFAHKSLFNCDSWYEMSEWHKGWQNKFHERFREVVIERDGKKHIADIKMGNLILELQHSSISTDIFIERSYFYRQCGHVVWLFDFRDCYDRMYTQYKKDKFGGTYLDVEWTHAKKFLNNALDYPMNDVTIFIQIDDNMILKIFHNSCGLKYFKGKLYSKKQFINHLLWRLQKVTPEAHIDRTNGGCSITGI